MLLDIRPVKGLNALRDRAYAVAKAGRMKRTMYICKF